MTAPAHPGRVVTCPSCLERLHGLDGRPVVEMFAVKAEARPQAGHAMYFTGEGRRPLCAAIVEHRAALLAVAEADEARRGAADRYEAVPDQPGALRKTEASRRLCIHCYAMLAVGDWLHCDQHRAHLDTASAAPAVGAARASSGTRAGVE